jgi:hypothetical protein
MRGKSPNCVAFRVTLAELERIATETGAHILWDSAHRIGLSTVEVTIERPKRDNALTAAASELLSLAYQYADDLRYPPVGDSRSRRLAAVEAAIARATGA